MASEAPPFWWQEPDWRAAVLSPLAFAYGTVARLRLSSARREKVEAPVLCVGNLTVGGAGKTPVAIALARRAIQMKLRPGFLSRGHGGASAEPRLVDPEHDSARTVGDEPMLLAAHAPVAVTPDRAAGARLLIRRGCDLMIMDDGFQSARIHFDFALIVVDARHGIGNGRIIPAGPLRAPVLDQMRFADAVIAMGEGDGADAVVRIAARAGKPVFRGATRPQEPGRLSGRRFVAFAGIGHPEKFFETVTRAGGTVALSRSFPDHHAYSAEELRELSAMASAGSLDLITTTKDAARLRSGLAPAEFLEALTVLAIEVTFDEKQTPTRIIEQTLAAWRKRRSR